MCHSGLDPESRFETLDPRIREDDIQNPKHMPTNNENKIWDVVIIGAGPAGMMAAGRAAELGKKVLILEKNTSLGKKLLITGGGRCNVTNNKTNTREMLAKYKGNDQFLFSAFSQFDVTSTLAFFNDKGMPTKEENEGRIFPVSNSSQSVYDVLYEYMKTGGVEIRKSSIVSGIEKGRRILRKKRKSQRKMKH